MSDIDPDTPAKPIEVPATPVGGQAATAGRDLALVLAALPALLAIVGKRDLIGIINYIASDGFAPALGVIVTASVVVYRQWLTRRNYANVAKLANNVPDYMAIVKDKFK